LEYSQNDETLSTESSQIFTESEKVLMELINLDPSRNSHKAKINCSKNKTSILLLIRLTPDIFKKKYRFRKAGINDYPFVMLCRLGASSEVLQAVYSAYPKAIGSVVLHMIQNNAPFSELQRILDEVPDALTTLKTTDLLKEMDSNGETPLHLAIRMKSDDELIRFLISTCPESLKIKNSKYGWTPFLHLCARRVTTTRVELEMFVKDHPEVLKDKSAFKNNSPLHLAVWNRQPLPVVEFLLERMGKDVLMEKTSLGATPLYLACQKNVCPSVVKRLLDEEPAALMVRDSRDNDPFILACCNHTPELVEYIVEKYPDVLKHTYYAKLWNVLQAGAFNGFPLQTMKLLVQKMDEELWMKKLDGRALEVLDEDGKTLLHLAVAGKKNGKPVTMELIEYLVKENPKATKMGDKDGNLPMDTDTFLELTFYLQAELQASRTKNELPQG
jgi:ankyrin repeat protein